ncbi:helix-turn-helix transcriptional regulator [Magnetococcus sp. PR-3]|uniref:helix-turn-helix transcriptional regulator n=1 Tax=Magnetococcus sp. PR-3 TaxID=3120355 RepID=UPI002FCE686E
MDRTERFYRITGLLSAGRAVSIHELVEEMEVSRATVKRDIEYLRDRLSAPIIWDRKGRGYRFEGGKNGWDKTTLPGVWFNASEIYALLTMEHLLSNLQPGLLGSQIEPLKTRLRIMLESGGHNADEVANHISVVHIAGRTVEPRLFQEVAAGVLSRKRLKIRHHNRRRDDHLDREVSPQRLVFYRDSWYLDTWCHERDALRSFGMDAIRQVESLNEPAIEVDSTQLDEHVRAGYGIFSGTDVQTAVLRFSPEEARWVAHQHWHSQQEGEFDAEGYYILKVPYANDTELIMDILRHGSGVEVLEPPTLRKSVKEKLKMAISKY